MLFPSAQFYLFGRPTKLVSLTADAFFLYIVDVCDNFCGLKAGVNKRQCLHYLLLTVSTSHS
jgi:hypothetical protein